MKRLVLLAVMFLASYGIVAQTTPCKYKYGETEADSLKCLEDITSFNTFYKQQMYHDAYHSWKNLVANCPCSWNGIFVYSQTMLDKLIKDEKDSLQRERYIDTLLWSYEVRHLYFPDNYTEGNGLGFKAFNTMRYRNANYQKAYEWFVQSIELEKAETQPNIWDVYFKTAEGMVKVRKDTTIIIDAYERATEYIDDAINNAYKQYEKQLPNLANLDSALNLGQITKIEYDKRYKSLTADTARQMKLISNYTKTLSNIDGIFSPYAPCPVLVQVYSKKLEMNKENMPVIKKIVSTMFKKGCTDSQVFKEALAILHQAEPGAQSAYFMGNLSLKSNEIDKAIEYFNEAIKLYETNEQKVNPYYMLGLALQLKGNYSEARAAAYNAIKIKPNFGNAYILIGDLYANSGALCSGGDNTPYANNWAAADKYNKAAAVDPSCAEAANAKRARLSYPNKEEKFKRGLNAGDSYHVGCWIQENTTVR